MVFDTPLGGELFLVGRLLFGALLAFMGVSHFRDAGEMSAYAAAKGVPAATLAVVGSGVVLVLGGLGIAVGAFPALAAGALAIFLIVTTPLMHDFWAVPEEQRESELISFMKNVELLGASLVVLALGGTAWPYAMNVGLF